MDGAADPCGLDVSSWKKLCTSFQSVSDTLCVALSAFARRLATTFVDLVCPDAFIACCLIALDKHPGVQPFGVGEICQRLLSKTVLSVIRNDVLQAAGPLQLCAASGESNTALLAWIAASQPAGWPEAVFQVDASNTFNCFNRQAALRSISVPLSIFCKNFD